MDIKYVLFSLCERWNLDSFLHNSTLSTSSVYLVLVIFMFLPCRSAIGQ